MNFAESLLKLPQEIRTVQPTMMLAPPRMWERIYSTICTELRKRPAVARKAFYGALGMALAAANYKRAAKTGAGPHPPSPQGCRQAFFSKVRERLGGRLVLACSGAAPLSKELAEFYEAIGMPLIEGYGLTEGGVVTLNPLDSPSPAASAPPFPASNCGSPNRIASC